MMLFLWCCLLGVSLHYTVRWRVFACNVFVFSKFYLCSTYYWDWFCVCHS